MKKTLIYLFFVLCCATTALAQSDSLGNYMKPSIDGYIHLYFDQQYFLVDEHCPFRMYTRVIKYNKAKGGFNSFFTDYDNNNLPAVSGEYHGGKKDGTFKVLYPNGKTKILAYFKDDLPVGNWKYYYPSGNIWINVKFENATPYIFDYWDTKGRQKVKEGKGNYEFREDAFAYNPYGYTATEAKGKIKKGRPSGVWSNSLVYPKGSPEWIGAELFQNGNFVQSQYTYPENTKSNTSLIKILPTLYFENAEVLRYKNCTIDEIKGYNDYLKNYLNTQLPLIWRMKNAPTEPFKVNVIIDRNGQSTAVKIDDTVPEKFALALQYAIENVPFWIPSYLKGTTINDTLGLTLQPEKEKNGSLAFGYPIIKRMNGN